MWLIPGVSSSRAWIHQANAQCESLLCHWAEPWSALAHAAAGGEHPDAYLATAWKWLLQNHPHDSICGCSIDQVHEDMKYRFSQCRRIAERLTIEALAPAGDRCRGRRGRRRIAAGGLQPADRAAAANGRDHAANSRHVAQLRRVLRLRAQAGLSDLRCLGRGSGLPAPEPGDGPGEGPLAGRQIPGAVSNATT